MTKPPGVVLIWIELINVEQRLEHQGKLNFLVRELLQTETHCRDPAGAVARSKKHLVSRAKESYVIANLLALVEGISNIKVAPLGKVFSALGINFDEVEDKDRELLHVLAEVVASDITFYFPIPIFD